MVEITISKGLLGGKIDFVIYDAPREIVEPIVDEAYAEGLRLQKIFNMYDPKSELSLLNRSRKSIVSNDLLMVLKKALAFSKLTKGSYDVTLGKSILLRKQGKAMTPHCSYKDVIIKGNEVTLVHPEAFLDLGSVAKGYIADRLAEILHNNGVDRFLIDARGDICVRGDQAYVLGVQHPRDESSVCSIKLKDQAVATSGDYMQYSGTFGMSHIINQKDAASVTVVAPTVEEADIYATAIFTSSSEDRKNLIESNKKIKVLIVEKDNDIKMFNDFEELVHEVRE